MSTILQALEKARQERERQIRKTETPKKKSGQKQRYGYPRKPPRKKRLGDHDTEEPPRPSRFPLLAIFFFVLGIGLVCIALYILHRVEDRLRSLDQTTVTKSAETTKPPLRTAQIPQKTASKPPLSDSLRKGGYP